MVWIMTMNPGINIVKLKKLLLIVLPSLLIFMSFSIQAECIVENEKLIKEKTAVKIEEMCSELKEKTGISTAISAIMTLKDGKTIVEHEKQIAEKLSEPYVIFAVSLYDKKVDILPSSDLSSKFDEDEILDHYVIPLLTESKKDDELRTSAAVFNGTVKIFTDLASSHNIKLASIPAEAGDAKESNEWNTWLRLAPVLAFILVTIYFLAKHKLKNK